MNLSAWHALLADMTEDAAESDTPGRAIDLAAVSLAMSALPDGPTSHRLAVAPPGPVTTGVLRSLPPGADPHAVLLACVRASAREQVNALRTAVDRLSGNAEPRTPHDELVRRLAAEQDGRRL
ncbi:hypothetical protein LRS13_15895 [Svornostia abyssi]|uniref:Uncharacterized protein n=1 Tax=Svornostia abyssi TaxID=2898438 RepID=A0ABY5PC58_9ACTN|nr:hypothetical protein LRS13_15895 [Parviterribacteraceae bacterium J379]